MAIPTSAAPGAFPTDPRGSSPGGVKMTFADLHAAANRSNEEAAKIREQAKQMAGANAAAAAANPFAALTLGADAACAHMSTALYNAAQFHENHANALHEAAKQQRESDLAGEATYVARDQSFDIGLG